MLHSVWTYTDYITYQSPTLSFAFHRNTNHLVLLENVCYNSVLNVSVLLHTDRVARSGDKTSPCQSKTTWPNDHIPNINTQNMSFSKLMKFSRSGIKKTVPHRALLGTSKMHNNTKLSYCITSEDLEYSTLLRNNFIPFGIM